MKSSGHFQPMPETQALWDALTQAKANGDRNEMGKLSGQIQRASAEAKRNADRNHTSRSIINYDAGLVGDSGA